MIRKRIEVVRPAPRPAMVAARRGKDSCLASDCPAAGRWTFLAPRGQERRSDPERPQRQAPKSPGRST